jgi:hypothetical protein
MALKGRTAMRIGAVVVGLGGLAWHQFHHPQQAATGSSRPAASPTGRCHRRNRRHGRSAR